LKNRDRRRGYPRGEGLLAAEDKGERLAPIRELS
jgi:hypothetical protein